MLKLLFTSAMLLMAALTPVHAQDEIRNVTVKFAAGTSGTTISDKIRGYESVSYKLGASAGQVMNVTLGSRSTAVYFNIYEPGRGPGDQALVVSENIGPMVPDINIFSGTLPASGEYIISVYQVRAAARRNEVAAYTLDVSIGGKVAASAPVKNDYADGLEGGPDYWAVSTGTSVNLRAAPSTGAAVVGKVYNGTILRNLGCRMAEGRRWCQVETLDGSALTAWTAGDFLVESGYSGGTATQLPAPVPEQIPETDALVPGTDFNATGMLDCSFGPGDPVQNCDFGVTRTGGGNGFLTVFLPDGGSHVIFFEAGTPNGYDQSQADQGKEFTVSLTGDMFTVYIGDESYVFPDVVLLGD